MKPRLVVFVLACLLLLSGCGPDAQSGNPRPPGEPSPTQAADTPSPEADTASPEVRVSAAPAPPPAPDPTEEVKELRGFPIDNTHDAFEVPTGGKLGTLLVTVEQEEEGEEWPYRYNFSVWAAGDLKKPIQTMTAEGTALFGPELIDANFDGYMDFRYQRSWGTGGDFYHHWVWDEAAGQFVVMPELSEYGYIEFDAETQTVRGGMTAGVWHEDHIYRWECGELVFSRIIKQGLGLWSEEDDTLSTKVTVSDWVNGEWTEVWSEEFSEEDCWDEVAKWLDLSYHGET